MTIASGSLEATINVSVLDDTVDEPDETFTLTLSNAVNASISEGVATGTIVDDDEPTLSIEDVSVAEDASTATFTVTFDTASIQTVTVDYATTDGTATAGADYTATRGTLTIAAGSLKGTINVYILDDTVDEADETFTLTLSNAVNASIRRHGRRAWPPAPLSMTTSRRDGWASRRKPPGQASSRAA